MFIDQAKVFVKAGQGGRGCNSLYRDQYNRKGFPDGGDGGKGADIIIRVDRNLFTLLDFKFKREFLGAHGAHGSGKNKTGKNAQPIIIRVPRGTVIKDAHSGFVLRDLTEDGDEIIIAKGGAGGLGNQHHQDATEGEPGEEKQLLLDLKLIAEAGLVGFPNVGKSTLISVISNAHPKVAAYPFTTKSPCLGVVKADDKDFVIADIPGLIEGSSEGKGLGDQFLRHVERTKILVHVIDMSGFEGRDPVDDYKTIIHELNNYSKEISSKTQIIVANKMDLKEAGNNLLRFKKIIKKKIYPVSALKKSGLEELIHAIAEKI